jgi:hypothetical protein
MAVTSAIGEIIDLVDPDTSQSQPFQRGALLAALQIETDMPLPPQHPLEFMERAVE